MNQGLIRFGATALWKLLRLYSWKYWSLVLFCLVTMSAAFHYADGGFWYSSFIAILVGTVTGGPAYIVGMREMPDAVDKVIGQTRSDVRKFTD